MKTINTYIKSRKGYRLKRPKKNHNSKPAMKIQIKLQNIGCQFDKKFLENIPKKVNMSKKDFKILKLYKESP